MNTIGVAINSFRYPTLSGLVFKEIPDAVGQSSAHAVLVKRGVIELLHCKAVAKIPSFLLSDALVAHILVLRMMM